MEVDIRAELLGVDLHSDAETALGAINAALARRDFPAQVELLTWYQLPADMRGMYPCLLEAAGQPAGRPFTVLGLSTQSYQIERPLALTTVPDALAEYGKIASRAPQLSGARYASRRRGDCRRKRARIGAYWRLLTTDPPGGSSRARHGRPPARSVTDVRLGSRRDGKRTARCARQSARRQEYRVQLTSTRRPTRTGWTA